LHIGALDPEQILQKILVTEALDSAAQESCIEAACININFETNSVSNKTKLLTVDSMTNHAEQSMLVVRDCPKDSRD
jgi:hypothetical protein